MGKGSLVQIFMSSVFIELIGKPLETLLTLLRNLDLFWILEMCEVFNEKKVKSGIHINCVGTCHPELVLQI